MSSLPRLAVRPCQPEKFDIPGCYVIKGEKVLTFGQMEPRRLLAWRNIMERRYIHPDHRPLTATIDWSSPKTLQDAFMIVLDLDDTDPELDRIEFVLNDEPDPELQGEGDHYKIAAQWGNRYLVLQKQLVSCLRKVLRQYPEGCLEDEGEFMIHDSFEEYAQDLARVYDSPEGAEDVLFALKLHARSNLSSLNYVVSTQSWWRHAVSGEERVFVDSLDLPARPKRGVVLNLLSDWSYVNIPLLLRHNVPIALVWSEPVNAVPRFARMNPAFLIGYYTLRRTQGLLPQLQSLPVFENIGAGVLSHDHLFQDRTKRVKGSPILEYDPNRTYLAQYHEGWRGEQMTDPDAIRRSLEKYECYEKALDDGSPVVIIQAWSLRNAATGTLEETYELGFVATQSSSGSRLGETAEITVDERREMYRLKCAPWAGGMFEPEASCQTDVVPSQANNALALLERLYYPDAPVLEHSVPPPVIRNCAGLESPPAGLLERMDVSEEEEELVNSSDLARRLGGFVSDDSVRSPSPAPTTHSSWRTETSSVVPFSESSNGRRSASPRRGIALPVSTATIAAPDPARFDRSDFATPGSPKWDQRLRLFQACFTDLLSSLSAYEYPRADIDLFNTSWASDFLHYGFIFLEDPRDRLRVLLWMMTQGITTPDELLNLCLVSGIRFYVGYRTDAPMPLGMKELAGPRPTYHEAEYLRFGGGGKELYEDYKSVVADLCRRVHAASFLFYGGIVSAIAAHYGKGLIEDRIGEGIGLTARFHKLGEVKHPYREGEEVLTKEPSPVEINKLLGLVIGRDGQMLLHLFPPPTVWEKYWPGNGEWTDEEEDYFQDLVAELEKGTRTAMTEAKWDHQLRGVRHGILTAHPERGSKTLSMSAARRWMRLFDYAFEIEDDALRLDSLRTGFGPSRLPLFR